MSALEGLKIVDFSRFLPGAYASWIAADMGAEVIRIEHPRELAKHAAMFGGDDDEAAARRRRARPTYTRNKRSFMINPGSEAARPVLERLIAGADVLIEDYRPGVMAAMGYGYDALAARDPRLVYLSVSFTGQTGPYAGRAGHDPAALALAGALSRLNGLPTPSLPGLQVADVLTGAHATIALLLALQARARSGRGQHVDVAMSDASMTLLLVSMGRHDDLDELPALGAWHPKGGVWACADGGFLCTTDMEPAYWRRFCEAIGRPDFAGLQHDVAQHPAIQAELAALFRTRTRDEWFALLSEAETQAMPVYSPEEALAHPHNVARGRVIEVPLPNDRSHRAQSRHAAPRVSTSPDTNGDGVEAPTVRQLALPFVFSETQPVEPVVAGPAGADNAAILAELSFDAAELAAAGAFDQGARR